MSQVKECPRNLIWQELLDLAVHRADLRTCFSCSCLSSSLTFVVQTQTESGRRRQGNKQKQVPPCIKDFSREEPISDCIWRTALNLLINDQVVLSTEGRMNDRLKVSPDHRNYVIHGSQFIRCWACWEFLAHKVTWRL